MNLVAVAREPRAAQILYDLLRERTPEQSISHRKMPTYEEHLKFVESRPYQHWYLIQCNGEFVGSIYLTKQREIGIFIFRAHQGKGYAQRAVQHMRKTYPGRMLANVNPANVASQKLFERLGSKVIQWTFEIPEPESM